MKLLVDIGNSRVKWALLSANALLEQQAKSHNNNAAAICEWLFRQQKFSQIVLAHVLGDQFNREISEIAKQHSINLLIVHSELQAYGIETTYLQADKLGVDRFITMLAAHHLNTKRDCIVIDCVTATTIDAIDATGKHIGGVIFPGLQLCEDSLINKAKNLLKIKQELKDSELNLLAKTTAQGVKTGCHYSLAATIDRICKEMEQVIVSQHTVKRIICGGNAKDIHTLLDGEYELNENLLMQGLQFIANK